MEKVLAPAVFSGKEALKKAMAMKSFMHEKILSGQVQAQKNEELRQQKLEKEEKMKQDKMNEERKISERVAKEKKDRETSELTKLLN